MTFRTILACVDGSKSAAAAVEIAADIAQRYQAELILLHVVPSKPPVKAMESLTEYQRVEHMNLSQDEMLQSLAAPLLEAAETRARDKGATSIVTAVESGDPATTIAAVARLREVDLIVVGRRGLGDLAALLMGSVSHKLIQLADRPCLTVG